MPVISFLNPKGGCGKTTLSLNVADTLHRRGYSVCLVDTDPQASARAWHSIQEDNPLDCLAADSPGSIKTISKLAESYDYVIVDGQGRLERASALVITQSDLVLIPIHASPFDVWAMDDLLETIKTRMEITRGQLKAAFVISDATSNTKLIGEVRDVIKEAELPALQAYTARRQAYLQSASEGLSVHAWNNTDAKEEISAITTQALALLEE